MKPTALILTVFLVLQSVAPLFCMQPVPAENEGCCMVECSEEAAAACPETGQENLPDDCKSCCVVLCYCSPALTEDQTELRFYSWTDAINYFIREDSNISSFHPENFQPPELS